MAPLLLSFLQGPDTGPCASSPPITATLLREHFSFRGCWTSHSEEAKRRF